MPARNIAILLFEDVEVLDFCGPLEVFSVTGQTSDPRPFRVFTVAEKPGPISTVDGLSVNPAFDFSNCPRADILIVPGGIGTRKEMHNGRLLRWITEQANQAELVLSVCTGAPLLAKAGLLDGLSATTHHSAISLLKELTPRATMLENNGWSTMDAYCFRQASAPESIYRCMWFAACLVHKRRPKPQHIWSTIGATPPFTSVGLYSR